MKPLSDDELSEVLAAVEAFAERDMPASAPAVALMKAGVELLGRENVPEDLASLLGMLVLGFRAGKAQPGPEPSWATSPRS